MICIVIGDSNFCNYDRICEVLDNALKNSSDIMLCIPQFEKHGVNVLAQLYAKERKYDFSTYLPHDNESNQDLLLKIMTNCQTSGDKIGMVIFGTGIEGCVQMAASHSIPYKIIKE
jgi:hypothetical protein